MSNKTKDGGPAFPARVGNGDPPLQVGPQEWVMPGMTMRDYFAAKAMQGALTGVSTRAEIVLWPDLAEMSYEIADAMLHAREK